MTTRRTYKTKFSLKWKYNNNNNNTGKLQLV